MAFDINLKIETKYDFSGKVFSILITGISSVYLARVLTQYDYGLYQKLLFLSIIISQLLKFNFEKGLFYFYHRFYDKKSIYVVNAYSALFLISITFIVLGLSLTTIINRYIDNDLHKYVIPIIFLISLNIFQGSFAKLFVIERKAIWSMYYKIGFSLLRTLIIILAVIKFEIVYAVIIVLIIVEIIKSIFTFIYLKKMHNYNIVKLRKDIIRDMLKYNIWVAISGVLGKVGQSMDKIILLALVSTSDFAIYAIGFIQIPLLSNFYNSIGDVSLTKFSHLSSSGIQNQKALNLYKTMLSINALITFPIICFGFFYIENIILLFFGKQYITSANIFIITNLTTLIQMTGFGYIIRGYGNTRPLLLSNTIRLILGIILGYIFINHFGIIGAAISYTTVYFLNGVILLHYSLKIIRVPFLMILPWKSMSKMLLISLLSLFIVYPLKYFNLDLLYHIPMAAALYTLTICTLYTTFDLIKVDIIKKIFFKDK